MNLFDHLNNISLKKDFNVLKNEDDLKSYNEFMIDRYLSMDKECVFYTYLINKFDNIQKSTKYLFYLYMIPKRKRFFKYFKKQAINEIEIIQRYFKISEEIALQYLSVLNKEQVNNISKKLKTMKGR